MKKDMLKKYALIAVVFTGLLFGGSQVFAESNNSEAVFSQRLGIITQLMSIMEKYPEFEDIIQPFIAQHLESIFADMDSYKNRGQQQKAAVKERNEIRKDIKEKEVKKEKEYTNVELSLDNLVSIEAERYLAIDNKWKIEAEFENGDKDKDVTFYVYDIKNIDELIPSIKSKIKQEFGFSISEVQIGNILDIDND